MAATAAGSAAAQDARWPGAFADAPSHFVPPPLDPTGATLVPEEVGPGIWLLRGDRGAVDNVGVVVGRDAVLVIDAHINRAMAEQALARIREISPEPIRYLVNTNRHGDHVFGNAAFPATTSVVGHRTQVMTAKEVAGERAVLTAFTGRPEIFDGTTYRPPDRVFDERLVLDLGGRSVELIHVGPVNTVGDVVVHVPDAGVVFTGNLFTQARVPLLWEGDASDWVRAADVVAALRPRLLVPGHLGPVDPAVLVDARRYGAWLGQAVDQALAAGWSPARIGEELSVPDTFLPSGGPGFLTLARGFHALNALRTAQIRAGAEHPAPAVVSPGTSTGPHPTGWGPAAKRRLRQGPEG